MDYLLETGRIMYLWWAVWGLWVQYSSTSNASGWFVEKGKEGLGSFGKGPDSTNIYVIYIEKKTKKNKGNNALSPPQFSLDRSKHDVAIKPKRDGFRPPFLPCCWRALTLTQTLSLSLRWSISRAYSLAFSPLSDPIPSDPIDPLGERLERSRERSREREGETEREREE